MKSLFPVTLYRAKLSEDELDSLLIPHFGPYVSGVVRYLYKLETDNKEFTIDEAGIWKKDDKASK